VIQKHLLFPTHVTKPVPEDWAPHGDNSEQAFLNGNCGQLHVAIWRRPNAKGKIQAEWVENATYASYTLFHYRNRWLKRLLP